MTIQVKRKYVYITEYEIQGFYSGAWECENTETTLKAAKESLKEYRENMPNIPHRIKWVTEKIDKFTYFHRMAKDFTLWYSQFDKITIGEAVLLSEYASYMAKQ